MENKKCKFCGKEIQGHTKKQVEHMMNQHIIGKHSDKIEIKEKSK